MPKGITIQEAAARLADAGIRLGERYRVGTTGKGSKWSAGASGAEANYKTGVAAAAAAGMFGKGVSRAGPGAYDEGVRTKGVNNWPTGMQFAGTKYQRNAAAAAGLWNQPLKTPKGARRSAANRARITENLDRFQALRGA